MFGYMGYVTDVRSFRASTQKQIMDRSRMTFWRMLPLHEAVISSEAKRCALGVKGDLHAEGLVIQHVADASSRHVR